MSKETLPKFYKVIIVITFLIACFFFLRWFDGVRPKYEIREQIIDLKCVESGCLMPKEIQGDVIQSYCVDNFDGWYKRICYIKEKVRIQ